MPQKEPVKRWECEKHVKRMTEEIKDVKDAVNDLRVDIAGLPEVILEKSDSRYADKKTEKTVDKVIWLIVSSTMVTVLGLAIGVAVIVKYVN